VIIGYNAPTSTVFVSAVNQVESIPMHDISLEAEDPYDHTDHEEHFHVPEGMFWEKVNGLHKFGAKKPKCCYCTGCGILWLFAIVIILNMGAGTGMIVFSATSIPFYLWGDFTAVLRSDATYWGSVECTHSFDSVPPQVREQGGYNPRLQIFYREKENMFTPDYLEKLAEFEEDDILAKKDWENEMCLLVYEDDNSTRCTRGSQAVHFFAKNDDYFPTEYDDFPSIQNTLAYYNSLMYNTDQTITKENLDLTEENIDRIAEFWASYGREGEGLDNQDYFAGKTPPRLQYFDNQECVAQYTACENALTSYNLNTCSDGFEDFSDDVKVELALDGVTDCSGLKVFLAEVGFGCDDSLAYFGTEAAGHVLRENCCAECFEDWFGTSLDTTNCASESSVDDKLSACIEHMNGEYFTYFSVTLQNGVSEQEMETAIKNMLTDYFGIQDYMTDYILVTVVDDGIIANKQGITVEYPWETKSTAAASYLTTSQAVAALNGELGLTNDVTEATMIADVILDNDLMRPELRTYTVANKMFEVVDGEFGSSSDVSVGMKSTAVISTFKMGIPLEGYASDAGLVDQYADLGQFCWDNYNDKLLSGISGLDVFWNCNNMDLAQTSNKLGSDIQLVLATITFISVYMIFTTGSYFLAANGMFMIFFNFFPAMAFYAIVSPFFGILHVMAVFIVLSVGADDVFVLLDTWAQTNVIYGNKPIEARMTHTLGHAGKVMMTTSLSTTVSFLANCTSAIPAISTFGWFCGILIICNYANVCLFFPTVLMVHEFFFSGENNDHVGCPEKCQACSGFCRCGCRSEMKDLQQQIDDGMKEKIDPNAKRPIDKWMGTTFYGFIHHYKILIIIALLLVFCIFLGQATKLETDPNPPNVHPTKKGKDGYNYSSYWAEFGQTFTRQVSEDNVFAWVVFGITGTGLPSDRGVSSRKKTESINDGGIRGPGEGNVQYDDNFNIFGSQEMGFLEAICEDMLTGERYDDASTRLVSTQSEGSADVVACPIVDFRNWIWSGSSRATWNFDDGIDPYTLNTLDADLKTCMEAEDYGFHTPGTWPIEGKFNNLKRFSDFMGDDVDLSKFGAALGQPNRAFFSDTLWLKTENYDFGTGVEGCTSDSIFRLKFLKMTVKLDATRTMMYGDGIDLYEKWEQWLDRWLQGDTVDQTQTGYTPNTDHCDLYSDQSSCIATNGCSYDANGDTPCFPTTVSYPGTVPEGVQAAFITDQQFFAYYYLQEKLIGECYFGIGLAIGLAFVILNIATGNWVISLISTLIIGMLVLMVMGFTVMQDWKLGMLEAVIYVMVVGMSVDYVVHLAEAYLESKKLRRSERVSEMLETRAFSVLSGAVSTAGGIFWLLFAYVLMFVKFSTIMFFLVCASLIYSVIFFAAVLDMIGPEYEFGNWSASYKDWQQVRDGKMTYSQCFHHCVTPSKEIQASRSTPTHSSENEIMKGKVEA